MKTIKEDFMHGVPEHVLRRAAESFVDDVRQQVTRFIMTDRSRTKQERHEAITRANDVLEELEKETYDLMETKLFQFVRSV